MQSQEKRLAQEVSNDSNQIWMIWTSDPSDPSDSSDPWFPDPFLETQVFDHTRMQSVIRRNTSGAGLIEFVVSEVE